MLEKKLASLIIVFQPIAGPIHELGLQLVNRIGQLFKFVRSLQH
jgi:hypothetical protein